MKRSSSGSRAPLLVVAVCGALLSLALPPTGWWPFALALAGLFAAVANARTGRRAFALGAAFAIPFFAIYIFWLPQSFSALLGPAFWALFPLLVIILGVFWGATTWASWFLSGGGGRRALLVLPAAWVLVEWARTQGYFAFPWGTLGYLWLDTPAAQAADTIGVYGLSLLATASAALFAVPLVSPRQSGFLSTGLSSLLAPALAVLLVVGAFSFGERRAATALPPATGHAEADGSGASGLRALLVQGNLDAFGRLTSLRRELDVQLELTREAERERVTNGDEPFDLVLWPEGAVLGYDLEGPGSFAVRRDIQAAAPDANFIIGGRYRPEGNNYNSAYSIAGSEVIGRYDKHYLVPFGERWPFIESLPGVYQTVFSWLGLPLLAGTSAGPGGVPLATAVGAGAAFVCYESVFPQVQQSMVAKGARVLLLITNDAWFAFGTGGEQHFAMGRMRAIETRRWLLRAGNDGITAAVDPTGTVTARLERRVPGYLVADFDVSDEITPWVRHGSLASPLLITYLALIGVVLLMQKPVERPTVGDRMLKRDR
ncbi:MAG: apolipoprotein N-acyltransferase [Trueperaceae bacterium]|nr:apolipoprotein N-acyltransferase [Trueperaceae bacterium]